MSGRRRRAAPPLSGEFSAQPGVAAKKRGKRELRVEFSAAVREPALKERVAAAWACKRALNHGAVVLDPVPFHHCVIPNFIQSEDFLEGLQKELLNLDFQEKSNDLYKFKQSSDLKKRKEPHIVALRLCNLSYDSAHAYLGTLKLQDLFLNQPVEAVHLDLFLEGFGIFLNHIEVGPFQYQPHTVGYEEGTGNVGGNMPGKVLCETLVKVLFEEFRVWLSNVTQVDLEPTIDLSCAKYDYTDTLLCHDDELEGRRIAFILYLVPPWDKADGGTLDLFSTDGIPGHLRHVFLFSLHHNDLVLSLLWLCGLATLASLKVAEVISKGKCRLSVSGWFHGPPVARTPRHIEPLLPLIPHIPCDHKILYDWINPVYLEMDSQTQIQEEFEDRSEILLKDFLKRDKFHLVCEALKNDGPMLSSRGPPNKRFYKKAEEESLPTILKECMELLGSEAFFLLLSNFTGLKLHFLAPTEGGEGMAAEGYSFKHMRRASSQNETDSRGQMDKSGKICENEDGQSGSNVPLCAGELRHWTKSCYTLIHDAQTTEFALDLLLFCGCEDWVMDYGGFTSYIAKGEDEELLTISPENNCLALVYRDQETLKFVKYINHRSLERTALHPEKTGFWDFCFVYYECSEEEDHQS